MIRTTLTVCKVVFSQINVIKIGKIRPEQKVPWEYSGFHNIRSIGKTIVKWELETNSVSGV